MCLESRTIKSNLSYDQHTIKLIIDSSAEASTEHVNKVSILHGRGSSAWDVCVHLTECDNNVRWEVRESIWLLVEG